MAALLTPLALLHGALAWALGYLWWKYPAFRRRLLWVAIPFFLLTALSTDPVRYLALGSLEWPYPPSEEVPEDARAIVVLAGSIRSPDSVRTQADLGPNTLYRCLHAVLLHCKAKDRPILVSGGPEADGDLPYAKVMRDFLVRQGVEPTNLIVEDHSHNTYESAVACGRILRERGIDCILLVTSATHMARASGCFQKQGFRVVPSPCEHRATQYSFSWKDIIPDTNSVIQIEEAWHEWLGLLIYKGQGRL